ncbi:MAG: hypothetical protein KGI30_09210 [Planctomycetota bacterium]|nr:hypothetical protein [Planctomycetota bacterium]
MRNAFYRICSLKEFFAFTCIMLVTYCNVTLQKRVCAEGQTKYSKNFFDAVEPIRVKDPLSVVLGAMDKGEAFTFTYADAVKFAGHSCPAVAGAYKSTQIALKLLYGDEAPVRGNIKVIFRGVVDHKVNGPISQVVTLITGAAAESGFKGLGPAGKYGRYNLMAFDKDNLPDPKAVCSMIFQRVDNGKKIEVTYSVEHVSTNERIDKLMPLVISGKASEDEAKEFGDLWQERVKTILLNPPEGTFLTKEL